MSWPGLIIGLGGTGARLAGRLKAVQTLYAPLGADPALRLLAIDRALAPSAPAVGEESLADNEFVTPGGDALAFTQRVASGDALPEMQETAAGLLKRLPLSAFSPSATGASDPNLARLALLADLNRGAQSRVLSGLARALADLKKQDARPAHIFLTCSTFGNTGRAWLLDIAYLVRLLAQPGGAQIHAVLLLPDAFSRALPVSAEQRKQSALFLRSLDRLQTAFDWSQGMLLFGRGGLAGIPGRLTARPFDSLQPVDGGEPSGAGLFATLAWSVLAQLDEPVRAVLDGLPPARGAFTITGAAQALAPAGLFDEQAARKAEIDLIEELFPLEKEPATGRAMAFAAPHFLRPEDRPGNLLARMFGDCYSGVMLDVLEQAAYTDLNGEKSVGDYAAQVAGRSLAEWEAALRNVRDGSDDSPLDYLTRRHIDAFRESLAARLNDSNPHLPHALTYLEMLNTALEAYLQVLERVRGQWLRAGEDPEDAARMKHLADARRDLDRRKGSWLTGLLPAGVESTRLRVQDLERTLQQLRRREEVRVALRAAVEGDLALSRSVLEVAHRFLGVLALDRDAIHARAQAELDQVDRLLRYETAARAQLTVSGAGSETRRIGDTLDELGKRIRAVIRERILAAQVDGRNVNLDASVPGDPPLDLTVISSSLAAEEIHERLVFVLLADLRARRLDNSLMSHMSFLHPRADQAAESLVQKCAPLARTLTPVYGSSFVLAPPAVGDQVYARDLLEELEERLPSSRLLSSGDPLRLGLLRWIPDINLDALSGAHE